MFMMHYSLQGEVCIMGMKRIFQKLKANVRCVKARDQYISQMSDSCPCTEADFEWWVPLFAATLFTSLNPVHNTLSVSRGRVYKANVKAWQEECFEELYFKNHALLLSFLLSFLST